MNVNEAQETPRAKWGTAGEYCYCTTGSSDYCEFCDSWVSKCWCWDDDEDEDDGRSYAEQINAPLSPETIEALREALESGEHARFRRVRKGGSRD